MKKIILITLIALTNTFSAYAATYNFTFNNTEQGDNSTATPNVTLNGEPVKIPATTEKGTSTLPTTSILPTAPNPTTTAAPAAQNEKDDSIASVISSVSFTKDEPRFQIGAEYFFLTATPNKSKKSIYGRLDNRAGVRLGDENVFTSEKGGVYDSQRFIMQETYGLRASYSLNPYIGFAAFGGTKIFGGEAVITPIHSGFLKISGTAGYANYLPNYLPVNAPHRYEVSSTQPFTERQSTIYLGGLASAKITKNIAAFASARFPQAQSTKLFIVEKFYSTGVTMLF